MKHHSILIIFGAFLALMPSLLAVRAVPDRESAVYAPDETVRFRLYEFPDEAVKIDFRALNLEREPLLAGSAEPGGSIRLEKLPLGYYEFDFTVRDASGRALTTGRWPFAVIPRINRDKVQWEKNQFGAMVMPHTAYPMADRRRDAEMMNRVGMRFVRGQRLNWVQVQPDEKRAPDWKTADEEVAIYRENGLEIVANTAWPLPRWASAGFGRSKRAVDKMYPADDRLDDIRAFYSELGRRYRGKVAYWEVGNEVDAALFWLGRPEHIESGDKDAIIKDFCDYFVLIAQALKAGDPAAQVGPNTTGRAPDGHTYRDWLRKFLADPAAKREMNFFSTHYRADFDGIRQVFREKGVPAETDVIVTEIGGMGSKVDRTRTEWEQLKGNIRVTYIQCAAGLTAGAKALCKFLLREIPNVHLNEICGMLEKDFRLRPEFVAYATMIRMIGFADPAGERNVVRRADRGWLNCWTFKEADRQINLLVLNDAGQAEVVLDTPDSELLLTDPMGRERTVKSVGGKVKFRLERETPLFVTGRITPEPGPVKYPEPEVVATVNLSVNSGFEEAAEPNRIPGWKVITDELGGKSGSQGGFKVEPDATVKFAGDRSLRMSAAEKTKWYGVMLDIPAEKLPKIGFGQYLELTVRYRIKTDRVQGTGTAVTFSLREKSGRRISWKDSAFEWGTFGWEERTRTFTVDRMGPELGSISVEFYLGQATGTVWLDEVEVTGKLWQKSGADAMRVN